MGRAKQPLLQRSLPPWHAAAAIQWAGDGGHLAERASPSSSCAIITRSEGALTAGTARKCPPRAHPGLF